MFIDTHSHLTFPDFKRDIERVISRATDAGINKIIVPSISFKTSLAAIELAERFNPVYAAVGVHPQDSQEFDKYQFIEFKRVTAHPKVVAIGEIGLDYYRDYAPHDTQKKVFEAFLQLAIETDLPVIIHNRSAFSNITEALSKKIFKKITGVFHCFSEAGNEAQKVMEMGFFISFTGTITFKNSKSTTIAKNIAIESQLLETDAPFMAPTPNRGKRNEPAYLINIAEKQAELHGLTVEEVGKITTDLAYRVFPKLVNE